MQTTQSIRPDEWTPVSDDIVSSLHDRYQVWIADLSEIRDRMNALRDEHLLGWRAPIEISSALNFLHREDERFAAEDISGARRILAAAEANSEGSKAHRMVRIERCKERIAALERAYNAEWRPLAGLKWPEPAVIAWCSMFGAWRFCDLDSLETTLGKFEALLLQRPKPRLGPKLMRGIRK